MKVNAQEHYGVWVATNVEMDQLRKKECLCLNCTGKIFDGVMKTENDCITKKELYNICVRDNVAMMITRCPYFTQRKE
jgi:hypothetical protein